MLSYHKEESKRRDIRLVKGVHSPEGLVEALKA